MCTSAWVAVSLNTTGMARTWHWHSARRHGVNFGAAMRCDALRGGTRTHTFPVERSPLQSLAAERRPRIPARVQTPSRGTHTGRPCTHTHTHSASVWANTHARGIELAAGPARLCPARLPRLGPTLLGSARRLHWPHQSVIQLSAQLVHRRQGRGSSLLAWRGAGWFCVKSIRHRRASQRGRLRSIVLFL